MFCYSARDTFGESVSESDAEDKTNSTRERFREMLRNGKLDDKEIEVEVTQPKAPVLWDLLRGRKS